MQGVDYIIVGQEKKIYALVTTRGEVVVIYPQKAVLLFGSKDIAAEVTGIDFSTFFLCDESKLTKAERDMLQGMTYFGVRLVSEAGVGLEPSVPAKSSPDVHQDAHVWAGTVLQRRYSLTFIGCELSGRDFGPHYRRY